MNGREYFDKNHKGDLIVKVFEELCRRVGATLEDLEFIPEDSPRRGWKFPVHQFTWIEEEKNDFGKWMVEFVFRHRRVFGFSYATRKMIRNRFVAYWLLDFGWKYKKEERENEKI